MKFGVVLPQPRANPQKLVEYGKKIAKLGFDSIWSDDHLVFFGEGYAPEAWTILTTIGLQTKNVTIGTAVSDPHRCHPAFFAQRLATITNLIGDRVILGLGAGEVMNLDPYGIPWDKPVSRMREAIEVMRKLWESDADNPVNYEGRFFRLEKAYLQIKPKGKIPIYIGANSPRTRRLTGEIADGWIPNLISPGLFKKYLKDVEEGAKHAGRSIDDIEKCVYVFTVLTKSRDEAFNVLSPLKHLFAWPEDVINAGYKLDIPEHLRNIHYTRIAPQDISEREKLRELGKLYPDEICFEFTISGTVDDCISKIEEYAKCGVEHIILQNFSPDFDWSIKEYSEKILPHFRE